MKECIKYEVKLYFSLPSSVSSKSNSFPCCLFSASFEVIVTDKHLLAIRGGSAVLGCEFTPDPDLSNLVVTWQRSEDSQVVHSFYYQQDQLDRQSPEFHNRTSLFISELHKGNASLRVAEVRPKDAGLYLCIVSNAKGTGKALMNVTYGGMCLFYGFGKVIPVINVSFGTENWFLFRISSIANNNQNKKIATK